MKGQAVGGAVQGLGGALLENMFYDESGQVLSGSLADYFVPFTTNFPLIRAVMLGLKSSPVSPLSVKGGGEGGTIPMGGLMANAIASALSSFGVQPHALPLSPPAVWELIQQAREEAALATPQA